MELQASIRYQGALMGVTRYDFTNESGERVKGVNLHVSTTIPPDQGVGYMSRKYSYKGPQTDYEDLCALVGQQVAFELNAQGNGVLNYEKLIQKAVKAAVS